MEPETGDAFLNRARAGIREALAQWDASDLPRVESSRQLLMDAVADMRRFETAVRAGDVAPTAELCSTILAMKQEIAQAALVVDACVAFYRGLAARTGDAPPVYDAKGSLAGESAPLESEVHA